MRCLTQYMSATVSDTWTDRMAMAYTALACDTWRLKTARCTTQSDRPASTKHSTHDDMLLRSINLWQRHQPNNAQRPSNTTCTSQLSGQPAVQTAPFISLHAWRHHPHIQQCENSSLYGCNKQRCISECMRHTIHVSWPFTVNTDSQHCTLTSVCLAFNKM